MIVEDILTLHYAGLSPREIADSLCPTNRRYFDGSQSHDRETLLFIREIIRANLVDDMITISEERKVVLS